MQTIGKRFLSFQNHVSKISSVIDEVDTRAGLSVKNWHERMLRGLDASTPYTRTSKVVRVLAQGHWVWSWKERLNSTQPWVVYTGRAWGNVAQNLTPFDLTLPVSVDNAAKAKFIEKLNEVHRTMDGGVALGEIGKTLKQLRNPLNSLRKAFESFAPRAKKRVSRMTTVYGRRRVVRDAATRSRLVMDALTGTYLEWKFGIQPTLSDLSDTMEVLEKASGTTLDAERIRGSASWDIVPPGMVYPVNSNWALTGDGPYGPVQVAHVGTSVMVVGKGKVTYSGSVAVESPTPGLRKEFGLSLDRFVPTVWNLLPWSWAVDTAFNVGNVLDALCAAYGSVKWANKAVRKVVTERWSTAGTLKSNIPNSANRADLGMIADAPSIVEIEALDYVRIPVEASIPTFIPRFTLDMPNPRKLLNLSAAIWQANRVSKDLDTLIRHG